MKREQAQAAEIARLNAELAEVQNALEALRKKYDTAAATIGELKQRLQQLGQNVDQLASERGKLAAGLEDAEKRLDELRRQKAAAEARAATFRSLVDKLRSMIDAGQLKVTIRNGRMLIVLPNDVLFDSGRIDLKAAGKTTLDPGGPGAGGHRRPALPGGRPHRQRADQDGPLRLELGAVDRPGGRGGQAAGRAAG